jgi:hypothetical protein
MIKIIRSLLIIIFIATFSLQANSETTWITKKDSTKKDITKKLVVKKNENKWIKKKKKEKEKKVIQKVKDTIKKSKSWITKKNKKEKKIVKKNLKKHYNINSLPKGELYFAAKIIPKDDSEEFIYLYGYLNSEIKSKTFKYNNKSYHRKSNGYAYFEGKKTSCEVNSQTDVMFGKMWNEVILNCNNNLTLTGEIKLDGKNGKGIGGTTKKNEVFYEFFTSKSKTIAKLDSYKKEDTKTLISQSLPSPRDNKNIKLKPNGKYYALLIGNSKYKNWAALTSPANDVNEIGRILKNDYNFEKVMILKDGNRKDIFKKLKVLSNITTDKDYVLIYYSGHGDEDGTQRYWIPIDGEIDSGYGDWININDIQRYIQEKISNTHIVMMSDSCYFAMETKGNQIQKNKKSQSYQKLLERRAVMIVGSGSNEPVSDTSQNKHSMFGMSFIQSLRNNNNAIRMRDIVENIIVAHSGMQQQPYGIGIGAWGHSGGDFIFIKK